MPDQQPMTSIETAALDASVNAAKTFFAKIFGPAADEFGMQLADNMRIRRLKNQIKNLEKVQRIVEKENITMKQIDLKALVPLLEATALEENEELQNMWTNLFTNYIDAGKNLLTHVYPGILRQLSSDEVAILKRMQAEGNWIRIVDRETLRGNPKEGFAYSDEIRNLIRLGIVEGMPPFKSEDRQVQRRYDIFIKTQGKSTIKPVPADTCILTEFGKQFLEACSR
jgi:hypothetical protein